MYALGINIDPLYTLRIPCHTIFDEVTFHFNETTEWNSNRHPTKITLVIFLTPYIFMYIYTGCPRRNVPDFGRVFLMLKYNDITQNTYIQSWTVTEIMPREKWGVLAVPNTATCTADTSRDSANVLDSGMQCSLCLRDALRSQSCYVTARLSYV